MKTYLVKLGNGKIIVTEEGISFEWYGYAKVQAYYTQSAVDYARKNFGGTVIEVSEIKTNWE